MKKAAKTQASPPNNTGYAHFIGGTDGWSERRPTFSGLAAVPKREGAPRTYHCKGFDLDTGQEAYEHFYGRLIPIKRYGDYCNGHDLYVWDEGGRHLSRCSVCGGLVLVQRSQANGFGDYDDVYYTDYFPVDSEAEAEFLNEHYSGFGIEDAWDGRKIYWTPERKIK